MTDQDEFTELLAEAVEARMVMEDAHRRVMVARGDRESWEVSSLYWQAVRAARAARQPDPADTGEEAG